MLYIINRLDLPTIDLLTLIAIEPPQRVIKKEEELNLRKTLHKILY